MKVSVAMITYNHEKFIAQAIESVLMQETDFDYELVIGEDCSTDQTRELVRDYQRQFPDKVRLLLPEKNIGMHRNLEQTLKACTGQYIALLEGDDYWTSPRKLQKQVDFLDKNPECSICFHPVLWFYDGNQTPIAAWPSNNSVWPKVYRERSTVEDLLSDMFIQTGSVMLRNGLIVGYPKWLYDLRMADWPLYVLYANHGPIACLSEVMSAYRNHATGIWFSADDITRYRETIKMYDCLNVHFGFKYAKLIRPILADFCFKLAVLHDSRGEQNLAYAYIKKSIAVTIQNKQKPKLNEFKMMFRYLLPGLHALLRRLAPRQI